MLITFMKGGEHGYICIHRGLINRVSDYIMKSYLVNIHVVRRLLIRINDISLAVLPPKVVNDTISNTPLMAVPLNVNPTRLGFDDYRDLISLCYEIQGSVRDIVNLVSTQCTSIAARYAASHRGSPKTLFDAIGIRSVDSTGMCHNIQVDQECSVLFDNQQITSNITTNNISIETTPTFVVIKVPNCGKEVGVLLHCKNTLISFSGNQLPTKVMNITIIRGFGQQEESHGLIGMSPW